MSENISSDDEYEAARHIVGLDNAAIDPKMLEVQLGMATLAILQNKTNEFAAQLSAEIRIDMVPDDMKEDFIDTIATKSLFFTDSEPQFIDGATVSLLVIGSIIESGSCVGYRIQLSSIINGVTSLRVIYIAPEMPTLICDESGENMREEEFHQERKVGVRTTPDMYDPEVIQYMHARKDQGLGIRSLGLADAAVFASMLQGCTLDMREMKALFGEHSGE